jgi:hypothetical protein
VGPVRVVVRTEAPLPAVRSVALAIDGRLVARRTVAERDEAAALTESEVFDARLEVEPRDHEAVIAVALREAPYCMLLNMPHKFKIKEGTPITLDVTVYLKKGGGVEDVMGRVVELGESR